MTSRSGQGKGEFELIAQLFAPLSKGAPGALDLKDDAAFLDLTPGCELVITTDALISGVHFRPEDPVELIGRKALRVNLSDLGAKGARPLGFLQALTLNASIDDRYLTRYAAGLAEDVRIFAIPLLGGDTTQGPGPFTIAVTAVGEVTAGRAVLRSGARVGDGVYVTGTIGDAALGLACLQEGLRLDGRAHLVGRYQLPQPRLEIGARLIGIASASADISDGLAADVGHICTASGVSVVIAQEAVPLSPAAKAALKNDPELWERVLAGGDDYEIAFTAPASSATDIEVLAVQTGIPITRIGEVRVGSGVTVLNDGRPVPLGAGGWRHR